MSKEITVYWAPGSYDHEREPYNMVYRKPESLLSFVHGEKTPYANQTRCPAMKDRLNNVFVFKSAITEEFDFDLEEIEKAKETETYRYQVPAAIACQKTRHSNLKNYYAMTYSLNWIMFASEPVVAKFTAPYYPAFSPMRGALLATGEFDIGRWYRHVALEYHVPEGETHFSVKENDPLMFVEFMTDKKIVFKRYEANDKLLAMATEHAAAPMRYGMNLPLKERYRVSEEAGVPALILNEIKKLVVE
jgi:hypothetical protein